MGYELKEKGKCAEAIPHFIESIRLDPQPKGFLNLADCEEKLGQLSAALSHFVQARDVAKDPAAVRLKSLAEQRIRALETKLPKLIVKLGKDAPDDTVVQRDGVELGRVSLNVPLPTDPGKHTVVVRSRNFEKRYELTLAEGETKEIDVSPPAGATTPSVSTAKVSTPSAPPDPTTQGAADVRSDTGSTGRQRTLGWVGVGLGVAGVAAGTVFGLRVMQKNEESDSLCSVPCTADEEARYRQAVQDAKTARTLSIVGFSAGVVLGTVGAVLLLTSSTSSRSTSRIWISPSIGAGAGTVTVGGAW
jgi:hypothetical protein